MNDNKYWFISRKEWTEIIREIESPNPFRYQTFSIPVRKAKQLQQISYFDEDDYQSIIDHCLTYSDSCHELSQVFDLLANQYGAGHYLKSLSEQRKVLIDGLKNQHIVLLRETVTHSDYEPVQPTVISEKMTYLTDEQFLVSHMEDPTNWIEFEVTGVANEPFTLFNSKTGEIVTQGQLDALGHAYVEIPEETVFLVDVAFSKTKEYRSWYYTPLDYHSQILAGSVDAMASSLDAINDFHLAEVVPIAKLYQVLGLSKYFSPNSSGGSKLMPAKTQGGELIRSASAFITGFYLLDLAGFSYIKPVSTFGQYSRGVAAFGVVNATVTPVMEHRISDLLSKDTGLKSVVLDYLSVHPDDSNAEARFKNGLEGLALGAVLEPLFIVFRIIKNTLTRTLITRIPTRRTYKLGAEKVEIEPENVKLSIGNTNDFNLLISEKNGILSTISKEGILDFKINAVNSSMRGSEMFSKMMDHYGKNVQKIRGNWMNLEDSVVNKNLGIINKLTAEGVPLEKAITQTWTANQAFKYGFTESTILLEHIKGTSGKYTKVEVLFSKPQ